MGGIGTLPMDFGQPLEVPQQMPTNFSSAQNITMNPLLNYGQTQLGQAGGTPLTMRSGGITRLGYEEGGMGMEMMQPQMQEQAMMQPQMQQAPEGIMNAMPQEQGMQQQGMPQEGGQEETALLTIIQLLIEQGIPPEQAQELAMQILQVFAQGGAPAVEEFANQLEQQEGMQEPVMMAGGGIITIRQGAKFGKIFKSVGKAVSSVAKVVKSVAKSPIGQIALAIAAPYAIAALPGMAGFATLGGSGFMGAALRAGISNLAIQGITTGKINPKQALMAAIGGGVAQGVFGPAGGAPTDSLSSGDYMQYGSSVQNVTPTLSSGVVPSVQTGAEFASATPYDVSKIIPQTGAEFASATPYDAIAGKVPVTGTNLSTYNFSPAAKSIMDPTIGDRFSQFGDTIKTGITNLTADPLGTIGKYATSAYNTVKENAIPLATGFVGGSLLAQQPNESDDEYSSRAARDPEVAKYITLYGGGSKLYSPEFYKATGAVDPFAGRNTFVANGGRIGYEYGSMPMGEPRRNPAGIMELDYRAKGGFVPPVGIKEKADDIPAMLSNNEFVFTANAVRNAGGGNVNKGAQKMYGLMKQLEAGGMA
jgi:hypothetical protein